MISVLIFSKDRAMQLDGMLRSFFRWSAQPNPEGLTVLYATSRDRFRRQYQELGQEYQGGVRFVEETDFRRQAVELIGQPPTARHRWFPVLRKSPRGGVLDQDVSPSVAEAACILFLVDDALFVRPFSLHLAAEALNTNRDTLGFSFRLGTNTVRSYAFARSQAVPDAEHLPGGVMKYRWPAADGDFAYPLEVSSSLYRAATIARLLQHLEFSDPNTMESQMSINAGRLGRRFPCLLCWERSVAFSAPVNRVQEVFENRSGADPALSVESLANLFEEGQRIDLGTLEGFVPTACHQEVPLAFVPHTRRIEGRPAA